MKAGESNGFAKRMTHKQISFFRPGYCSRWRQCSVAVIKRNSPAHQTVHRHCTLFTLANTSGPNQRPLHALSIEDTRSSDYNADRYTRYYASLRLATCSGRDATNASGCKRF